MKTYAIIEHTDMNASRWLDVMETEETAAACSSATPKFIVKWPGSDPSWFAALGIPSYSTTADLFAEMATQGTWNPV